MCVVVITFIDQPDEHLICPICKTVFSEPWQTSCGHRFCKSCLDPLLRPTCLKCPVDGEKIAREESFRDKCCERELLDLRCSCRYKDRNCEWKGEFRNLKIHEEFCQYGDVQCQACGKAMEKRHLEQHRTKDCINRAVACAYCSEKVRNDKIEDHLQVCLKLPTACHLHCGKEAIPRGMMEEHLNKECPKAEVVCPFTPHGCYFKGKREIIEDHLKSTVTLHLEMMNQSYVRSHQKSVELAERVVHLEEEKNALEQQLQNQTEQLVASRINIQTHQTKISKIEESVQDHRRTLEKVHRDLEAVSGAVPSQMEEILNAIREHELKLNGLQSDVASLKDARLIIGENGEKPQISSSFHQYNGRLDRAEHQLALHEIQLSEQDLQVRMLEATSYDGDYLWKIDHFSRRFQEAVSGKTPSIYSPPFYVGRFGYKVSARLYPNGDGMGKGTHVSIFFVIMRGEYDALLPWPFSQKVYFKLIDQDRVQDACDSFRPDANSSSFKRPKSDMNIASGCPTFISHARLREGGYIKEDTMYVRVAVDKHMTSHSVNNNFDSRLPNEAHSS